MGLVERAEADNLIAESAHTATVQTVTIKAGEGELARGTVLARNASNKFVVLNTTTKGKAEVILAADVDASGEDDVVAEVYNSGDFFENALTVGEDAGDGDDDPATPYEIAEEDRLSLKNAGIYLIAGLA